MRRRITTVLAAAALLATFATTALAQLPPHEHFITTPSGEQVLIGPPVCNNPAAFAGFEEFHAHVHQNPAFQRAIAQSPNTFSAVLCPQP